MEFTWHPINTVTPKGIGVGIGSFDGKRNLVYQASTGHWVVLTRCAPGWYELEYRGQHWTVDRVQYPKDGTYWVGHPTHGGSGNDPLPTFERAWKAAVAAIEENSKVVA